MSKVVFLKDLKSKLNISDKVEVKKERYSWGNLRVIRVGVSFSVIIDPENWQKIDALKSGESAFFKDDQNSRWNVNFNGEALAFKDADCHSCRATVRKSELLMN